MVKKNKTNTEQLQSNDAQSTAENNTGENHSMNRRKLSKDTSLGSIQEEDSSSLDERLMIESFKSITDIFEKEIREGEGKDLPEIPGAAKGRGSGTKEIAIPKERTRSISEGTDSMDEEVRRIMSKEETNKIAPKVHKTPVPEKEVEPDDGDTDQRPESVLTDTESESESDIPFSDTETEAETSATDGYPTEAELSEEEEFDLDKYIDKLCLQSTDEESQVETEV